MRSGPAVQQTHAPQEQADEVLDKDLRHAFLGGLFDLLLGDPPLGQTGLREEDREMPQPTARISQRSGANRREPVELQECMSHRLMGFDRTRVS